MIRIGIDQSMSCTGLVILKDDVDMLYYGTIKTSKDEGSIFKRFNIISEKIIDLIIEYNVDEVKIEGIPFGRIPGNASRDLAGLQAVIISNILDQQGKECIIIPPKAVKKFATDNGNAKKPEMLEAVPEQHRVKFVDAGYKKTTGIYDLADAYFIGMYQ